VFAKFCNFIGDEHNGNRLSDLTKQDWMDGLQDPILGASVFKKIQNELNDESKDEIETVVEALPENPKTVASKIISVLTWVVRPWREKDMSKLSSSSDVHRPLCSDYRGGIGDSPRFVSSGASSQIRHRIPKG